MTWGGGGWGGNSIIITGYYELVTHTIIVSNANANRCEESQQGEDGEGSIEVWVRPVFVRLRSANQGDVPDAVWHGRQVIVCGNSRNVALAAVIYIWGNRIIIVVCVRSGWGQGQHKVSVTQEQERTAPRERKRTALHNNTTPCYTSNIIWF